MRGCHPDNLGGDNDEATEFCKMLNEIYEVTVQVKRQCMQKNLTRHAVVPLSRSIIISVRCMWIQTLMDPDRRALYDDLAGFSDISINPFLSNAHERDLVRRRKNTGL
jgi:hypothetical protein